MYIIHVQCIWMCMHLLYTYIPQMYMYNKQCTVIVNRLLLNFFGQPGLYEN